MSACISREGEYSNHTRSATPFICGRCYVFDEDAALATLARVERLTFMDDDGSEWQHTEHYEDEGEPECPACWAESIRTALAEGGTA